MVDERVLGLKFRRWRNAGRVFQRHSIKWLFTKGWKASCFWVYFQYLIQSDLQEAWGQDKEENRRAIIQQKAWVPKYRPQYSCPSQKGSWGFDKQESNRPENRFNKKEQEWYGQ